MTQFCLKPCRYLACIALCLGTSFAHEHHPRMHANINHNDLAGPDRSHLGFNNIDAHFVINLEKRKDRLAAILPVMQSINVTAPTIVRAVPYDTCGILGCGLSWVLALQECSDTNGTTCMIVEDDFHLAMNPDKAASQVDALFTSGIAWDVIMLSGWTLAASDAEVPYLKRVKEARSTGGLFIARAYARTLLLHTLQGAFHLNKDCKARKYFIDIYMNELARAGGRWYMFQPLLGYQKPSFSDIRKQYINYTSIVGRLVK